MRETAIALLITAMFAFATIQAVKHGQQVADLEHAVTVLEREVAARQQMLDDMRHVMEHTICPVECIDTGMDAHTWLWGLAEQLERQGVPVVVEVSQ